MRKSIVLIWDKPTQYGEENEIFLVDIEHKKRVRLVPSTGDTGFHLIYASLHPTLPLAVLFVSDMTMWLDEAKRTVELVDIDLFPVSSGLLWETRYLTRRPIAELGPLPSRHDYLYHTIRLEFGNIVLDEVRCLKGKISAMSWLISPHSSSLEAPIERSAHYDYAIVPHPFSVFHLKNTPSGRMTFTFREPDELGGCWQLTQSGRQGIERHLLNISVPESLRWTIALDDMRGIFVLLDSGKLWVLYC
ncbi:hypothetical protein B0H10DRAFT_439601 [Mycena sp. CBHHK59/15]|nr:hypothetical protein B0H10DRAFT_439601 [Mycena sp. CBHHK59/15]